jgi:hypothetical protein
LKEASKGFCGKELSEHFEEGRMASFLFRCD